MTKLTTANPLLEFSGQVEELTGGLSAALFIGEDRAVRADIFGLP